MDVAELLFLHSLPQSSANNRHLELSTRRCRLHRQPCGDLGFHPARNQQVRKPSFQLLAVPPSASSIQLKPDYYADEDDEDDGRRGDDLGWVMKARELAIESMRSRNFTDDDFKALLPTKLKLQEDKKNRKKKKQNAAGKSQMQKDTVEVTKTDEETLKKSSNGKSRKQKDEARRQIGTDLGSGEEVDPEAIKALAMKFNAEREAQKGRYMAEVAENYKKLHGQSSNNKPELESELSVVYTAERDDSEEDGSEVDDDLWASESEGYSPVTDPRLQEIRLNQDLVDSRDVGELLETIARVGGRFQMSPINVATALHRMAKHMVKMSMSETRRLKIARQRDTCELVALAMELLPQCSAQGLSNIAWAISKIGGHLLYFGEMELIAQAGIEKVEELNSQNVANMAGAFASMQHSSPALFERLATRAGEVAGGFRPQELAQVLWAFASMAQPVDALLDSLDVLLEQRNSAGGGSPVASAGGNIPLAATEFDSSSSSDESEEEEAGGDLFGHLTIEQLSSIAWSYAVLGQLQRPFFSHICKEISSSALNHDHSLGQHTHIRQLSQLHQTILSLKLEWNHLGLSLGDRVEKLAAGAWEKEKNARKSTSFLQKDMERFLFCTGRKWVSEYKDADYSLDFALEDEKIAIEVNGPSHFTRNTGAALGHMVLKRRLLLASGWKVISASYEEWENLEGEREHVEFMQKLVVPHLWPLKNDEILQSSQESELST